MMRTYPVYYLTIFVLSLCYQLGHCLSNYSNYTFTAMDDFNKTIPAVCWLTLDCPVSDMSCNNMGDNNDPCTINVSGLNHTKMYCTGSSRVTVNPDINVTIAEDNNTMDIISNSATLMCTPVVSCDEGDVNITWEVLLFNETNSTLLNDTDPSLPVEAEQYGNYTCTVTSANMLPVTLNYQLYGGPKFSTNSEDIRVTLNDRVEFACDPPSIPPIITIIWYKDGVELPDDELVIGRNHLTIVIEKADYDDEGVYVCNVNNIYNSDSKSFRLKVRSPLTPLWPAIGIILELSLVAAIIFGHERYKKYQEKKDKANQYNPSFEELKRQNEDDTEAYNFPSHSINYSEHERRQRVDSITKESLLPDSVQ